MVHHALPVKDVPNLTPEAYIPGAATPLIDACVKSIRATEEKVQGQDKIVSIVIQTDGYENASYEFSNEDLFKLVKEKTAEGWLFTFLGAGIDAFAVASKFGSGIVEG